MVCRNFDGLWVDRVGLQRVVRVAREFYRVLGLNNRVARQHGRWLRHRLFRKLGVGFR